MLTLNIRDMPKGIAVLVQSINMYTGIARHSWSFKDTDHYILNDTKISCVFQIYANTNYVIIARCAGFYPFRLNFESYDTDIHIAPIMIQDPIYSIDYSHLSKEVRRELRFKFLLK